LDVKAKDFCARVNFGKRWLPIMFVFAAGSLGSVLRAQDINIRILDGRNGHPVSGNLCLNVSIGTWHGADLLAPTNKDGIIVLHVGEGKVSAEVPSGTRCVAGFPTRAALPQGEDKITPASGGNDCQPFHKHQAYTPPSYSMQEILQHGVVAENVCGKPRVEAKPGELIFFVRPSGVLERLKQ
jgi:hypothetical protein